MLRTAGNQELISTHKETFSEKNDMETSRQLKEMLDWSSAVVSQSMNQSNCTQYGLNLICPWLLPNP